MTVYAESSAVVSWLLSEGAAGAIREILAAAEMVLSSELTLVECDRAVIRAVATGRITEGVARERQATLARAAEHWSLLHVEAEVIERARRPFPREPIRTLDAVHLASALTIRSLVPGVKFLSLDERVRASGRELGFDVVPAIGP